MKTPFLDLETYLFESHNYQTSATDGAVIITLSPQYSIYCSIFIERNSLHNDCRKMYWFKLWFENLLSIYPSKVLANNWPAMVPRKWVAQHYCPSDMCHKAEICFKLIFVLITFVMKWQIISDFPSIEKEGKLCTEKKLEIWRQKRRRPHVGNCAETTENPPPPQGFLLHPFTWPAVGTYGTWGCFAPPSPPSLIHLTRQTRSAGHLAAPIQREASRHWQTAKQASNSRPCVLISKDLMDT